MMNQEYAIQNFELITAAVGECRSSQLSVIGGLYYQPSPNGLDTDLFIDFFLSATGRWVNSTPYTHVARLRFEGVDALSLELGCLPAELPFIAYTDISDHGWERYKVSVADYEFGHFKLYAQSVSVVWVEEIGVFWERVGKRATDFE